MEMYFHLFPIGKINAKRIINQYAIIITGTEKRILNTQVVSRLSQKNFSCSKKKSTAVCDFKTVKKILYNSTQLKQLL